MGLDLDDFLKLLRGVERSGKGWVAFCPAHDDTRKRSLFVSRSRKNPKKPVYTCYAGCSFEAITAATQGNGNAKVRINYNGNGKTEHRQVQKLKRVDVPGKDPLKWLSDYTALSPEFLESQDIDFSHRGRVGYVFQGTNSIKYRPINQDIKGVWDLQGDEPPPLWPMLPDNLDGSVIFITAGETDCLCIRACGVDAFALTRGESSQLPKALLREIKEKGTREVVYVPDADMAGAKTSGSIRRKAESVGLEFRTLDLEAHLQASRGEKDLRALVRRVGIEEVTAILEKEYLQGPKQIGKILKKSKGELQIPWLTEPLIAQGAVTLLSGEAKAGKTTFMLKLLDAMHVGGKVLDYRVASSKVVYFSELTEVVMGYKAEQLMSHDTNHILLICRDNEELEGKSFDDAIESVFYEAKQFGADLIVVDTLAGLSMVEDENDASQVARALRPFRSNAKRYNMAVVLVHHLNKGGTERGSTVLLSEPDILVRIEGGSTPDRTRTIKVKCNLVLSQPDDVYFTMDQDGNYQSGLNSNDFDMLVFGVLPHKANDAISIKAICDAIDQPFGRQIRDKIGHVLDKLMQMGKVGMEDVRTGSAHQYRYYRHVGITFVNKPKEEVSGQEGRDSGVSRTGRDS